MSTTASEIPTDWRKGRRLPAWASHERGWSGYAVAAALGFRAATVSQWLTRAWTGGDRVALRKRLPPGPTPRLAAQQLQQLPTLQAKGGKTYGFLGEVWTTKRMATVICMDFTVWYHAAHVSRLLRQSGRGVHKPIRQAIHKCSGQ